MSMRADIGANGMFLNFWILSGTSNARSTRFEDLAKFNQIQRPKNLKGFIWFLPTLDGWDPRNGNMQSTPEFKEVSTCDTLGQPTSPHAKTRIEKL